MKTTAPPQCKLRDTNRVNGQSSSGQPSMTDLCPDAELHGRRSGFERSDVGGFAVETVIEIRDDLAGIEAEAAGIEGKIPGRPVGSVDRHSFDAVPFLVAGGYDFP